MKDTAMVGNEKDWLIIIEALELLQKESLEELRHDDFESLEEHKREYKERMPAMIAGVLRKVEKAYDGLS